MKTGKCTSPFLEIIKKEAVWNPNWPASCFMKKQLLLLLLLIFSVVQAHGQANQQTLDSLKTGLAKSKVGQKPEFYRELISSYAYINRDSATAYAKRYYNFETKRKDKPGIATALYLIGNLHYDRGEYDQALSNNQQALEIAKEFKDIELLSRIYLNQGSIYDALGVKDSAITNYLSSIALFDSLNDLINVAYLQINVGLSFKSLGQLDKAGEYYLSALSILRKEDDQFGIATVATNLASVFILQKEIDSALAYAQIGEDGYRELGYELYTVFPITTKANALIKKQEFSEALISVNNALPLAEDNEMNEELVELYMAKTKALLNLGRLQEAEKSAAQAMEISLKSKSLEDMRDAYHLNYLVNKKVGNTEEALESYEKYAQYKDSVEQKERVSLVNDLETQYRTAQKERQIAEQKLDINTKEATIAGQRNRIFLIVSVSGFIILLGLLIFFRNRQLQERKMQAALVQEKQKGLDAVITATEEERKRISKDLHDGIGQKLTALKLGLLSLKPKVAEGELQNEIAEISEEFTKSAEEVRQISHQMMPRALMEDGLVKAIEDLLQSTFRFTKMQYNFDYHGVDKRYPERLEVSLYRIVQELLNNALKHSEASKIQVQLMELNQKLILIVEDDGKGMKPSSSAGHGFHNIKSRLDFINGAVNYEPGPETGTLATVTIPLSS